MKRFSYLVAGVCLCAALLITACGGSSGGTGIASLVGSWILTFNGDTVLQVFVGDGTYTLRQNGVLIEQGTWSVSGNTLTTVVPGEAPEVVQYSITGGGLTLTDGNQTVTFSAHPVVGSWELRAIDGTAIAGGTLRIAANANGTYSKFEVGVLTEQGTWWTSGNTLTTAEPGQPIEELTYTVAADVMTLSDGGTINVFDRI